MWFIDCSCISIIQQAIAMLNMLWYVNFYYMMKRANLIFAVLSQATVLHNPLIVEPE